MKDVSYYTAGEISRRHENEPQLILNRFGEQIILNNYEAFAARKAMENNRYCPHCLLPVFPGDAMLYHYLCNPPVQRKKSNYSKKSIPADIRWLVWERDNFICQHCGTRRNLSIDHIYPEVKGGKTELDNLQTLCKSCNSVKGIKT